MVATERLCIWYVISPGIVGRAGPRRVISRQQRAARALEKKRNLAACMLAGAREAQQRAAPVPIFSRTGRVELRASRKYASSRPST